MPTIGKRTFAVALVAIGLSACGGGSGAGTTAPAPTTAVTTATVVTTTTVDLAAAQRRLASAQQAESDAKATLDASPCEAAKAAADRSAADAIAAALAKKNAAIAAGPMAARAALDAAYTASNAEIAKVRANATQGEYRLGPIIPICDKCVNLDGTPYADFGVRISDSEWVYWPGTKIETRATYTVWRKATPPQDRVDAIVSAFKRNFDLNRRVLDARDNPDFYKKQAERDYSAAVEQVYADTTPAKKALETTGQVCDPATAGPLALAYQTAISERAAAEKALAELTAPPSTRPPATSPPATAPRSDPGLYCTEIRNFTNDLSAGRLTYTEAVEGVLLPADLLERDRWGIVAGNLPTAARAPYNILILTAPAQLNGYLQQRC